jgi:hypothetical protein
MCLRRVTIEPPRAASMAIGRPGGDRPAPAGPQRSGGRRGETFLSREECRRQGKKVAAARRCGQAIGAVRLAPSGQIRPSRPRRAATPQRTETWRETLLNQRATTALLPLETTPTPLPGLSRRERGRRFRVTHAISSAARMRVTCSSPEQSLPQHRRARFRRTTSTLRLRRSRMVPGYRESWCDAAAKNASAGRRCAFGSPPFLQTDRRRRSKLGQVAKGHD